MKLKIKLIHLIYLLLLFMFISCGKENGNTDNYFFVFYPRQSKTLGSGFSRLVSQEYEGTVYYEKESVALEDTCSISDLVIVLSTSNLDTLPEGADFNTYPLFYEFHESLDVGLQQLDDNNTVLEQQIEDDYRNRVTDKSTEKSANLVAYYNLKWEYRTTGVSSFVITCTKPLFKQAAGTSLNSYLYIYEIDKAQIISYETNELVFGYSDDLNEMSINEWLGLKPMAQPTMYFRFNAVPEELSGGTADTVQFNISMKTRSGLNLSITTHRIALIN